MGLFGTYSRAEGGAHRRLKTKPSRACVFSSLLLASVSIPYVSSEDTGPSIVPDRVRRHKDCQGLKNDRIPPQPKLVGADFAENASEYSPLSEKGATSAECKNGQAGGYPCNNVNLLSMLDLNELNASIQKPENQTYANDIWGVWGWTNQTYANDIWGWTDENSNREFAIIGLFLGTAFVEITDPHNPVYLGALPSSGDPTLPLFGIEYGLDTDWHDIKTYKNYALVVSEIHEHGMQIFDLTTLLTANPNTTFEETAHYSEFGRAHNVFVNEDTGYAYALGSGTCRGGLHFVDLEDPTKPKNKGCYAEDGYTHDVQCVVYAGPDKAFVGREICFAANLNTITIVDVTKKKRSKELSRTPIENYEYTHQGWLTEDQAYFIFNDELDEFYNDGKTKTFVLDVRNLSKPVFVGTHAGRTDAIDHNMYVVGDLLYQANYQAGFNVLKIDDISKPRFTEGGYFDVYPEDDSNKFNGAWSVYPFFPSGVVIVSGIEQGLFMLEVGDITSSPTASPTRTKTPTRSAAPTTSPTTAAPTKSAAPTYSPTFAFTQAPSITRRPTSTTLPTFFPTSVPLTSAPTTSPQTIFEIAAGAGTFNTLVTALTLTGLDVTLSTAGPFTVFAPTDTAFNDLPAGTLATLLADPVALADILKYHVLLGAVDFSEVVKLAGEEVVTLNGATVSIAVVSGEVILNGNAKIVVTDIRASNGIVHAIDTVLIPPVPVTSPPTSSPTSSEPTIFAPTISEPTTSAPTISGKSAKNGEKGKKKKKAKFGKKNSKTKASKV
eukprot:CAMPEP_0194349758 /NCGR_PEP_ID=MMETSP0171-20130528/107267_1 /TAXON_ID=218684 /ORGANISM="Corethron pennatum, Strain L29A3" /LENGTH=776 /DNA_ID=CAMNT_0039117249 /DNA_START=92 /DNA_END=2422 /DNA_ORIENTATION=-